MLRMPKVLLILLLSVLLLSACRCNDGWFSSGDEGDTWSASTSFVFINFINEEDGSDLLRPLSDCQREAVQLLDAEGNTPEYFDIFDNGQVRVALTDAAANESTAFERTVAMYALLRYSNQDADTLRWEYQLTEEKCGRTDFLMFNFTINGDTLLSGSQTSYIPYLDYQRPALTAIPPC